MTENVNPLLAQQSEDSVNDYNIPKICPDSENNVTKTCPENASKMPDMPDCDRDCSLQSDVSFDPSRDAFHSTLLNDFDISDMEVR
jgi:hypothetical protein